MEINKYKIINNLKENENNNFFDKKDDTEDDKDNLGVQDNLKELLIKSVMKGEKEAKIYIQSINNCLFYINWKIKVIVFIVVFPFIYLIIKQTI